MRRALTLLAVVALAATVLVVVRTDPVVATPVATNDALYTAYGRVFPDPHGCTHGAPTTSPFAKGNVCAVQFVQWDEAVQGVEFLEGKFGRFMEVLSGEELREVAENMTDEELKSSGIPREDLSREKRDLYVVKVTDSEARVPEGRKKHFAYAMSIHGIERAGLEGGIRAIEDLVTWAACEHDVEASPVCGAENVSPDNPQHILGETFEDDPNTRRREDGPTAGAVLRNGVIYFIFANPDGWHRGEYSEGGMFFQRYNGNGMDLNRDWPTVGYTEAQYTPFSEPESRGYGKFLRGVRERMAGGAFEGAIDLHGMLTARSFSFTLLGAGQRDYQKNQKTVETSITTFRDAERRLTWSPLIAPADSCPGPIREPVFGGNVPMCSDQWGTVWDTINYQVTGSMGDWMDSPIGLDAVGIDNEMALSHLAPNNVFDPGIEQAHIDGNKGLIYSQIASLLPNQRARFRTNNRVGYIFDPARIRNRGGGPADGGPGDLPPQDAIDSGPQPTGLQEFRFEVKGPADGVWNGGLTVEATYGNVRGISPNALGDLILDYCGPAQHPGDPEGCREIARYFNQSGLYLQGGARIDLNDPPVGPYRIRANGGRILPNRYRISFTEGKAYPEPEQAPYNVSRMEFFRDLNRYAPPGDELRPIQVGAVLRDPSILRRFDTIVVANDFMPGFVPADQVRPFEPAGTPQDGIAFEFSPAASPVPQVGPNGTFEFDVKPEFDNDQMVVVASWLFPSDYDVYVERQNENGEWDGPCDCEFVNTGEEVTVFDPQPGKWRLRLDNFAAAPQAVEGNIQFSAFGDPGVRPGRFTRQQFDRYISALGGFASSGGNLVLTDAAMAALPALVPGLGQEDVKGGFFYAGWMDFDDGEGPTYGRHHLARAVNKEGTAEGQATITFEEDPEKGRQQARFDNRHQTYEPVPIGYYVSPSGSGNASCTSDRCDSPNWIVDQEAWEKAGGTTAARTLIRPDVNPSERGSLGTSLGEIKYGDGMIRIAGSMLPDPTEENYHPYGLFSYSLTYTGYQVFENLIHYRQR